ncbi:MULTISPECIES: class I SAM-dependent methyltransferase [unclassified Paenibacillus]|uniref:class I SAM-dependent methyltransferase n=1 Tax=unclassified Paenibacillus TaxID=185978 RepID=UPI0009A61F04|nr:MULTISPECIES: class I SAM-dependent methyltransferase [unclassified Paenibacillus]SLJ98607.1 Methyltransferase domain-containing protein [Paenibacillus sp. RU5A]SOC66736.1 Methyltransferase domain-containing protein [Paenibacillus sp. RU26A]SOC70130.1 Methyltransferase domain-containing protein [Paenibacillus sp. RU5M]
MANEQFEAARKAEAGYHSNFYQNNELFASGTWMARPMPMVMDMLERLLTHKTELRVLDLGCGVGRHTIPIAQRLGQTNSEIIGVDLLDEAVDGLRKYAKEYQVDHIVQVEKADVEHYAVKPDHFDYIAACSCLEHVSNKQALVEAIERLQAGTRTGGIHCITMSTSVEEKEINTGREIKPLIELNLPTAEAIALLEKVYANWNILLQEHVTQTIEEEKYDEPTQFRCELLRFAAQKQ